MLRPPALLIAGYLLLSGAWLMTNPPGAGPDEPTAVLKALAAARGQLIGEELRFSRPARTEKDRYYREITRLVEVDPELAPRDGWKCFAFRTSVSAGCRDRPSPPEGTTPLVGEAPRPPAESREGSRELRTYFGTYQPVAFIAPGVAARMGSGPESANRLARLATALLALALVGLGVAALWTPGTGALSLFGILLAATPMAVFLWSSSLSGSGLEVAGGICFFASILRISRTGEPPGPAWAGVAAGGLTLAVTRTLGPGSLVAGALLLAVLAGPRQALRVVLEKRRRAGIVAALVIASVGNLAWQLAVQPRLPLQPGELDDFLGTELPQLFRQWFGAFGWTDTYLNPLAFRLWALLAALAGLAALVVGSRRERVALVVAGLSVLAVTAFSVIIYEPTVARAQGRWTLPLAVAVPLLSAEVLLRNRVRLPSLPGAALPLVTTALVAVHGSGLYTNATRYAVGQDRHADLLLSDTDWAPPLGWPPWMVLAALGGLLLIAAAVAAQRPAAASSSP